MVSPLTTMSSTARTILCAYVGLYLVDYMKGQCEEEAESVLWGWRQLANPQFDADPEFLDWWATYIAEAEAQGMMGTHPLDLFDWAHEADVTAFCALVQDVLQVVQGSSFAALTELERSGVKLLTTMLLALAGEPVTPNLVTAVRAVWLSFRGEAPTGEV